MKKILLMISCACGTAMTFGLLLAEQAQAVVKERVYTFDDRGRRRWRIAGRHCRQRAAAARTTRSRRPRILAASIRRRNVNNSLVPLIRLGQYDAVAGLCRRRRSAGSVRRQSRPLVRRRRRHAVRVFADADQPLCLRPPRFRRAVRHAEPGLGQVDGNFADRPIRVSHRQRAWRLDHHAQQQMGVSHRDCGRWIRREQRHGAAKHLDALGHLPRRQFQHALRQRQHCRPRSWFLGRRRSRFPARLGPVGGRRFVLQRGRSTTSTSARRRTARSTRPSTSTTSPTWESPFPASPATSTRTAT